MTTQVETRHRILYSGLELLSELGLSRVTLGVLATRVGLSKSGLFAHFRSKEALQIALLGETGRIANAVVVAPAMDADAGLARLRALFAAWVGWTTRAGLPGGCPVAAALFELDDDIEDQVRATVLDMEVRWRGLLGQLTSDAVRLGQLARDLDVEQFVFEVCGIYLSHHASRRFVRDPCADRRAAVAFEALLARSRPDQATPSLQPKPPEPS